MYKCWIVAEVLHLKRYFEDKNKGINLENSIYITENY